MCHNVSRQTPFPPKGTPLFLGLVWRAPAVAAFFFLDVQTTYTNRAYTEIAGKSHMASVVGPRHQGSRRPTVPPKGGTFLFR